mgnify:CR=1 FL=1
MELKLGKVNINDIQFGKETQIEDKTLFINKEELVDYIMEDSNIKSVEIELARPGESTRIIPIKDIIQPRTKVEGKGGIFPGFVNDLETVGTGTTYFLDGCAVVTCGKILHVQEGVIDMSGPGAKYASFSKMNLVVPVIEPKEDIDEHTHEKAIRLAGLKTAAYLGEAAKEVSPDENEIFSYDPVDEAKKLYPDLPQVVYVNMIQCQGLMHDNYVYGLNMKGILPGLITPTEIFDGAIVSGNCAAPCHKHTTFHHQNNPIVTELMRRHGKELNFLGVILTKESTMLAEKKHAAEYTLNVAKMIGAQGAIISEEGGGNPETDLMLTCEMLEDNGIDTVLVTDEYAGRDGRSQGLADVTQKADAVVTNGNGNELVKLPPMDKVIGDITTVETIVGGFKGSLHDDGSISVELASLIGCLNEMGFENLTTKLK